MNVNNIPVLNSGSYSLRKSGVEFDFDKIPLGFLSKGSMVKNFSVEVERSHYGYISCSVGTNSDSKYFSDSFLLNSSGIVSNNNGNYFSSAKVLERDTPVFLFSTSAAGDLWTVLSSSSNMNTSKYRGGYAGRYADAFAFAGVGYATTSESFDGVSWSSEGALNKGREYPAGTGLSSNASLCVGGENSAGNINEVEEYNGTSWTVGTASTVEARRRMSALGPVFYALAVGGYNGASTTDHVELYDGISFSLMESLPSARHDTHAVGVVTDAMVAGGYTTSTQSLSFGFDGSSWSSLDSLNLARRYGGTGGNSSAAFIGGGYNGAYLTSTELYNGGNWLMGASINNSRILMGGTGTWTNGYIFGGFNGTAAERTTEEFSSGQTIQGSIVINFTLL